MLIRKTTALAAVLCMAVSTGAWADQSSDVAFAAELARYLRCDATTPLRRQCQLVYRGLSINTSRNGDAWKVGLISVPIGFLVTVIESRCVTVHDVRVDPPRFADLSIASGLFYASRKDCIEDGDA
jgi:hypothetical protein